LTEAPRAGVLLVAAPRAAARSPRYTSRPQARGGAPPQHRRAAPVAPRRPRAYAPIGARVLRGAGAYDLAIRGRV